MHCSHVVVGQVTWKAAIRMYGSNGGRWFSFVMKDDSSSVCIKAFNANCDRVYPLISMGAVSFNCVECIEFTRELYIFRWFS